MTDLFTLEPEYRFRADRARHELQRARYRRWRRRVRWDGPAAATDVKNWIN